MHHWTRRLYTKTEYSEKVEAGHRYPAFVFFAYIVSKAFCLSPPIEWFCEKRVHTDRVAYVFFLFGQKP
jgi:hypothetical protein